MATTKRSIQFRRNISSIYNSAQEVKDKILAQSGTYLDGEQIFGRYYKAGTTEVATLVGLVYVNEPGDGSRVVNITFSDASDTSKIDEIISAVTDVVEAVGLSGNCDDNNIGYSAHTTPIFIHSQNPTTIQQEIIAIEEALTPTSGTDATVSGTTAGENIHNNIISITKDGIEAFADLHYDKLTNKLTFVNTNGKEEIELDGVNFISSATYSADSEEIIIYYKKYGETSASTINIPVSGIIEEYEYLEAYSGGTKTECVGTKTDHNVCLHTVRNVKGNSQVYGDVTLFDCGTY